MRTHGSREITVTKQLLIDKLKENKKNHIKQFNKAIKAYKKEAKKQLEDLLKENELGNLTLKLDLITPINNSENYDKIIEMFKWEIEDNVVLTQNEFKEYVQDENQSSRQALYANMSYIQ